MYHCAFVECGVPRGRTGGCPRATTVTVSGTRIRKKTKHGRKSAGRVRRKERAGDLYEVQTEANGSPGSVFSRVEHDTPDHRLISI